MGKNSGNKKCKVNRNNPDPTPFIRIKNEPINETEIEAEEVNVQDTTPNVTNSNENSQQEHENEQSIQSDFNQIETTVAEINVNNLAGISVSQQNQRRSKQQELLQANNLLRIRIESLIKEKESLTTETKNIENRISELNNKNKDKKKLLKEKSKKISLIKPKITDLEENLKSRKQLVQQKNNKRKRVSLLYLFKFNQKRYIFKFNLLFILF